MRCINLVAFLCFNVSIILRRPSGRLLRRGSGLQELCPTDAGIQNRTASLDSEGWLMVSDLGHNRRNDSFLDQYVLPTTSGGQGLWLLGWVHMICMLHAIWPPVGGRKGEVKGQAAHSLCRAIMQTAAKTANRNRHCNRVLAKQRTLSNR